MSAKKFFLGMIAATLIGLGGIVLSFYVGRQELGKKLTEASEIRTDIDLANARASALREIQQDKDIAAESSIIIDELLPLQKDQDRLLADVLYTSSREAGIPINAISSLNFTVSVSNPDDKSGTEPNKSVTGVLSYPFTANIEGVQYEKLITLLAEIENNGRLVQVESVEINSNNLGSQSLGVNLSLKAFIKP